MFFFFSSRRRHTRFDCDWSSDVCSSDLQWEALINNFNVAVRPAGSRAATRLSSDGSEGDAYELSSIAWSPDSKKLAAYRVRSEERRVGKECRSRWSPYH